MHEDDVMKQSPDEQRRRWEQEWDLFQALNVPEQGTPADVAKTTGWNTVSALAGDPRLRALLAPLEMPRSPAAGSDGPDFHTASSAAVGRLLGRGQTLNAGTIVQLAGGDRAWRPVFLLVIEALDDERVTVVAFSPFSIPASEEELETGIDVDGLRVLALWSRRTVPVGRLREIWKVHENTGKLAEEVLELRAAVRAGAPPPEHLKDRLGSANLAPDDPRWAYFDMLDDLLAGVLGAV